MGNFDNYYKDRYGNEHRDIPLGTSPSDAYVRTNLKLKNETKKLNDSLSETNERLETEILRIDGAITRTASIAAIELENAVNNINESIEDISENVESIITSEVQSINARVNNIVAHNNDTEGNTELIDIRTGTDGTVYSDAGTSVRTQIEGLDDKIDQNRQSIEDIQGLMQSDIPLEHTEMRNGYIINGEYTDNTGYRCKIYNVSELRNQTVYANIYVYTQYIPVIGFYSSEMTKISEVLVTETGYYSDHPAVVPANAVYATLSGKIGLINGVRYTEDSISLKLKEQVDVNSIKQNIEELIPLKPINHWYGKKVVWLGTSVSFGANSTKSYAKEVSDALGFKLVNASVPGQAIHTTSDGGITGSGSTCLSIEEYQQLGISIAGSPLEFTPGGSYNNYYRTYEHIFSQENADADLWVFDVFPNNTDFSTTDWNAFDRAQWKYSDDSDFSEHRSTFYGALLFLLDKLYRLNPNARVVFVIGSAFKLSEAREAAEMLSSTALHYPYIDIWDRTNSNVKTNAYLYSNSGTDMHPSTKAHELMGRMLIGEFLRLA